MTTSPKHAISNNPLLIVTAWAFLTAMAPNPVTQERDFVLMTEAEEIELGRAMHAQTVKEFGGEYKDDRLKNYVERVGNRLVQNSHRSHLQYHFTILDNPLINAFALPGGYIYVTRGILAYINSEAELATLLGHEIAHVTARHGVKQHSKGVVLDLLKRVLTEKTGSGYYEDIADIAGTMIVHAYGREGELEADRLAVEYARKSGYDVRAAIGLLNVLKHQGEFNELLAQGGGGSSLLDLRLFATHPHIDDRLHEASMQIRTLPPQQHKMRNAALFMSRINGLLFGTFNKKERAAPQRVRVIVTKQGDTINSLAKQTSLAPHPRAQLRLLNGLYPDGTPNERQLFKLVQ